MFDEQLQKALKRTEKRKSVPAEVEKMSPRRRQNIKSERRFSCDNEISVQVNDEMMRVDDDDTLLQSDGADDSNDVHDNENTENYSDMVDYVPTEEDELDEDDDDDDEYELPKSRRRKNDKKDAQINETSYTVLESGDIALTTELIDIGEFPGSEGNCTCTRCHIRQKKLS